MPVQIGPNPAPEPTTEQLLEAALDVLAGLRGLDEDTAMFTVRLRAAYLRGVRRGRAA